MQFMNHNRAPINVSSGCGMILESEDTRTTGTLGNTKEEPFQDIKKQLSVNFVDQSTHHSASNSMSIDAVNRRHVMAATD